MSVSRSNLLRGADFNPPWPLRSGHTQTLLSSSGVRRYLLPRAAKTVLLGAEEVVVDGGNGVRLTGAYTAQKTHPQSRGLAVLFHTAGKAAWIPPTCCKPAAACCSMAGTSSG